MAVEFSASKIFKYPDYFKWTEPYEVKIVVDPKNGLGVNIETVQSNHPNERSTYTLLTKIKKTCSVQDETKLKVGDRIIQVNGRHIVYSDFQDVLKIFKNLRNQCRIEICLQIKRPYKFEETIRRSISGSTSSYQNSISEGSSQTFSYDSNSIDDFHVNGQPVSFPGSGNGSDVRAKKIVSVQAPTNPSNPSVLTSGTSALFGEIAAFNQIYDDASAITTLTDLEPPPMEIMKPKAFSDICKADDISHSESSTCESENSIEKLPLRKSAVKWPERIRWNEKPDKVELVKNASGRFGFHYKIRKVVIKNDVEVFYIVDEILDAPATGHLQIGDWIRSVNKKPLQTSPSKKNEEDDLYKEVKKNDIIVLFIQRPEMLIPSSSSSMKSKKLDSASTLAFPVQESGEVAHQSRREQPVIVSPDDIVLDGGGICMEDNLLLPGQVHQAEGPAFLQPNISQHKHIVGFPMSPASNQVQLEIHQPTCPQARAAVCHAPNCILRQNSEHPHYSDSLSNPIPQLVQSLPRNFETQGDSSLGGAHGQPCNNSGVDGRKILDDGLRRIGKRETLSRVPVVKIVFVSINEMDQDEGLFEAIKHKLNLTEPSSHGLYPEFTGKFLVDEGGFKSCNEKGDVHALILAKLLADYAKDRIRINSIRINGTNQFHGIPLSLIQSMAERLESGNFASRDLMEIQMSFIKYKQIEEEWPKILFTKNSLVILPIECNTFLQSESETIAKIHKVLSGIKQNIDEGGRVIFTSVQKQGDTKDNHIILSQKLDQKFGLTMADTKRPFSHLLAINPTARLPLYIVKSSGNQLNLHDLDRELKKHMCEQMVFDKHYPGLAVVVAHFLRFYPKSLGRSTLCISEVRNWICQAMGDVDSDGSLLQGTLRALHNSGIILMNGEVSLSANRLTDILIVRNVQMFLENILEMQTKLHHYKKWYASKDEFQNWLKEIQCHDSQEVLSILDKIQLTVELPAEKEDLSHQPMIFMPGAYQNQCKCEPEGSIILFVDFHGFMPYGLFGNIVRIIQQNCNGNITFHTDTPNGAPNKCTIFCDKFAVDIKLHPNFSIALFEVSLAKHQSLADFFKFVKTQLKKCRFEFPKLSFHIGPACPLLHMPMCPSKTVGFHVIDLETPKCCGLLLSGDTEISQWIPANELNEQQKHELFVAKGMESLIHQIPTELFDKIADDLNIVISGRQDWTGLADFLGKKVSSFMQLIQRSSNPANDLLLEWGENNGTLFDLMTVLSAQDDIGLKKIDLLEEIVKFMMKRGILVDCTLFKGLEDFSLE